MKNSLAFCLVLPMLMFLIPCIGDVYATRSKTLNLDRASGFNDFSEGCIYSILPSEQSLNPESFCVGPNSKFLTDYSSFQSIDEVIEYETSQILNADVNDYEALSEMYISRGETYLLCKRNELAFSDFQKGSELSSFCKEESRKPFLFRSLFGLSIVYGCKDMLNELHATADAMKAILASYKCDCNQEDLDHSLMAFILLPDNTCAVQPIIGPDRVPIQDCIEFAEGSARKCRYLISLVPRIETRLILEILIDDLVRQAVDCCIAGGIWKACLQPIVNKWYLWNQKWTLLRIPPDPAWD